MVDEAKEERGMGKASRREMVHRSWGVVDGRCLRNEEYVM